MTNEAAERLRRLLKKDQQYERLQLLDTALAEAVHSGYQQRKDFYPGDPEDLDAALAAERKATVERIRAAIEAEVDPDNWGPADWWEAKVVPILDKEAQT